MTSFTPPPQSALDIQGLSESLNAVARNISYFNAMVAVAEPHYELSKWKLTSDPMEHFWGHAIYNALMMGIIDWCKVFGSLRTNRTHWKKAFPAQMHAKVLADLHHLAGGDKEWEIYQQLLSDFRNKRAAHFDGDAECWEFIHTTPPLELAFEVTICLKGYVFEAIHIDSDYAPSQALSQQLERVTKEQSQYYRSIVTETMHGLLRAFAANPAPRLGIHS